MSGFMQVILNSEVTLPIHEVALVLLFLSVCFVARAFRVGLIVAFIFAFHLGWIFFQESFGMDRMVFLVLYMVFGAVVIVFALYQMFFESN